MTKASVSIAVTAGVLVGGAFLISAVTHQAAAATYTQTADAYDALVDQHAAAATALAERQELAATEIRSFLTLISTLPDDAFDPTDAKQRLAEAVDTFQSTAEPLEADTIEPASTGDPLSHAPKLAANATTEEISEATTELSWAALDVSTETTDLTDQLREIDEAYDDTILELDGAMAAARTWGDRDVYEKDTPEQSTALITAAKALVNPEREAFTGLADRVTAIDAFLAARTAALAGHEQTIAAEAEAAQQAAEAEAERQATQR